MCTCTIIECNWGAWSLWTQSCGEATRNRVHVGKLATVQKLSCDGLQKTCGKDEVEKKVFKCERPTEKPSGADGCPIKYASLGCYHDDQILPRPLPELILTERDPTEAVWNGRMIDWVNWNTYYPEFICRCAAAAKKLNYRFFSTQFYGECWSGPEAGDTYSRNGEKDYKHCLARDYKQCRKGEKNCIGVKETNYVFDLGDS